MKTHKPMSFIKISYLLLCILLIGCTNNKDDVLENDQMKGDIKYCPTNEVFFSNFNNPTKQLIVVLIKEHPSYKEKATLALNTIVNALPNIINPGDRLIILSMEEPTIFQAMILDEEIEFLDPPRITPSPTPPPPIGSLPLPHKTPQSSFARKIATENAREFVEETAIAATQTAIEFGCALKDYQEKNAVIWESWETNKQHLIQEYIGKVNQIIDKHKKEGFQNQRTQVFESLDLASNILRSECNSYENCALIIFSDLYDFRSKPPEDIKLNYEGVNVSLVLLDCNYQYECSNTLDKWSPIFTSFNPRQLHFVMGKEVNNYLSHDAWR